MTTLQSMVIPCTARPRCGILAQCGLVSSFSRLIRNCATLGGTLAAGIASQADLLTALAVLDAEVVVRSGSKRRSISVVVPLNIPAWPYQVSPIKASRSGVSPFMPLYRAASQ